VPVGCGARAKRICRRLRLPVYGFRTWRYTPQGLETNDISERLGVIKSLLPPIIRRLFE
jgi:hypothetical protein